jgi:hypothetical protein
MRQHTAGMPIGDQLNCENVPGRHGYGMQPIEPDHLLDVRKLLVLRLFI